LIQASIRQAQAADYPKPSELYKGVFHESA